MTLQTIKAGDSSVPALILAMELSKRLPTEIFSICDGSRLPLPVVLHSLENNVAKSVSTPGCWARTEEGIAINANPKHPILQNLESCIFQITPIRLNALPIFTASSSTNLN